MCSEARIDMNRLRQGQLTDRDFSRLVDVAGRIAEAPILIDDSSDMTLMELRSRARRLMSQQKLGLIVIDYLQLMSGPTSSRNGGGENRQQEIAAISRGLKGLARELSVPVIALSQLSRAVEARPNKRPMLSDLRESGCLTGDTLVQLADGSRQPIRELVGKSGFEVLALDETTQRLKPAWVSRAFSTGVKPVFALTTRLGRRVRATANHQFLTPQGWKRLDQLAVGDYLALPRKLASSQGQRLRDEELALLGHLIGDGCTAGISREKIATPMFSRRATFCAMVRAKAVFPMEGLAAMMFKDPGVNPPIIRSSSRNPLRSPVVAPWFS